MTSTDREAVSAGLVSGLEPVTQIVARQLGELPP